VPVKYICKKCGRVLWSFEHVGQDYFGIPTPDEIRRMYGVCPTCKREFEDPTIDDIVIKPASTKLVEYIKQLSTTPPEELLSEIASSGRVASQEA
jgi:DNA-directed RNA polymerase subunit RPC12/RpoP